MRLNRSILLSWLLLLPLAGAHAKLSFVLAPALQPGAGSNEVVFAGTLTNTSLTDALFLNQVQFTFTGGATNFLTAGTNAFFANVPGILLPGESYQDTIFGTRIATNIPPGVYDGTVTIQGGTNIFSVTDLSTQAFHVSLLAVPLGVARNGTNFTLSWPSPPAGFVLQRNVDISATNWITLTNAPAVTNGRFRLVLATTNGIQFFRLKYP